MPFVMCNRVPIAEWQLGNAHVFLYSVFQLNPIEPGSMSVPKVKVNYWNSLIDGIHGNSSLTHLTKSRPDKASRQNYLAGTKIMRSVWTHLQILGHIEDARELGLVIMFAPHVPLSHWVHDELAYRWRLSLKEIKYKHVSVLWTDQGAVAKFMLQWQTYSSKTCTPLGNEKP